jgi:hypothetical protein
MTFDNAWWPGVFGVAGALVGGLASLGGTVLNDYLNKRPAKRLDRIREDTLRKRFAASNRQWVQIDRLMDSIGADRETTVRHLLMTRRSMAGNDSWGLKDWPDPSN